VTPSRDEILADGRVCCILNLSCCNPPGDLAARQHALAEVIYGFSGQPKAASVPAWAIECAKNMLEHFDFVPAGSGAHVIALASAYAENLKKTAAHGRGEK
jgi:hypothetical protein